MRVFIAVTLPGAITEELRLIQNRLKKTKADIRWVNPANIHLTLKFLGDISQKELSKLKEGLGRVALELAPFSLIVEEMGCFPNMDRPRILWIGISRGREILKQITKTIEDRLAEVGFSREERSFHPHLTLGRFRSSKHKEILIKEMKKKLIFAGEAKIEKISIYRSLLTSEGPIYNILDDKILGRR